MENFIADIIRADLASGKRTAVVTRFPPEPNGYLHIGHAKAICVDFGLAAQFGGRCHLRMDDTNPEAESTEYVAAIQRDVGWLGFAPSSDAPSSDAPSSDAPSSDHLGEHLYFASDYFERLYQHAVHLIRTGKAYVCSLTEDEMREHRGSITSPGRPSPYRDRPAAESLALFERMRRGEFKEGEHVLRAKIDMASPNMKMRDPAIYRIKHAPHYRTGRDWCIYPLYDYTHCLSDAFEGITHSICTLEFENNRELYDWVLDQFDVRAEPGAGAIPGHPQQIEFARLRLSYTMMSKRKLLELVDKGLVSGWDDPRMPTLAGMRRRGYTPEAIRNFCEMIGVAKNNSLVDVGKLEFCIREDLNRRSKRAMCVLEPLAVTLTNFEQDSTTSIEEISAPWFPDDVADGRNERRNVPLSARIFIEREDFREQPPPKWHRLSPGATVRLRFAGVIRCDEVVKDAAGQVIELRCSYAADGRAKGTIHWVSADCALDCEVRLYDRLFDAEEPESLDQLNPRSLTTLRGCKIEPSLAGSAAGAVFQFERQGYFCVDPDSVVGSSPDGSSQRAGKLVFNRTVTLRDSWAKAHVDRERAENKAHAERERAESDGEDKPRGSIQPGAGTPDKPGKAARAPAIADLLGEPKARALRYRDEHDLSEAVAIVLAQDAALADLFEAALRAGASGRSANIAGNLIANELRALGYFHGCREALPFGGKEIAEVAALVASARITHAVAKELLLRLGERGGSVAAIVAEIGAGAVAEADLAAAIDAAIAAHPDEAARFRAGKTSLAGFFVGQVMRATRGQADAKRAQALIEARLRAAK